MTGKDSFYEFIKVHPHISLRKPEFTTSNRSTAFNETEVKYIFNNLETLLAIHHFDDYHIYNVDGSDISHVQKNLGILASKGLK